MKQIKKANLFDSFEIVDLEEKMEFSGGAPGQGCGEDYKGGTPVFDYCGGGGGAE
jgi:hypothetical protein